MSRCTISKSKPYAPLYCKFYHFIRCSWPTASMIPTPAKTVSYSWLSYIRANEFPKRKKKKRIGGLYAVLACSLIRESHGCLYFPPAVTLLITPQRYSVVKAYTCIAYIRHSLAVSFNLAAPRVNPCHWSGHELDIIPTSHSRPLAYAGCRNNTCHTLHIWYTLYALYS
jgi:hypothetical protein